MKNTMTLAGIAILVIIMGGIAFLYMGEPKDEATDTKPAPTVANTNNELTNSMEKEEVKNTSTIADLALATEDLSTLVSALSAAELVEVFMDEDAEYTVFAPTNAAFADIQDSVDTLLLEENKADLQNVLQYHVVKGAVYASDLEDGMTVTMLNGDTATVTIKDGKVMIGDAIVTTADVKASNGVVHIIDTVLLPN